MDQHLRILTKRIHPPKAPKDIDVDWKALESHVKLTYPDSFKDFTATYGGSVWFDNVSPFYTEAQSDEQIRKFLNSVKAKLKPLVGNMYDERFRAITRPLYPESDGLFPFMIDYGGGLFCWQTEGANPNKWNIIYWNQGEVRELGVTSISKLFLDFMDRAPTMIDVWGDINDYEERRIGLK